MSNIVPSLPGRKLELQRFLTGRFGKWLFSIHLLCKVPTALLELSDSPS